MSHAPQVVTFTEGVNTWGRDIMAAILHIFKCIFLNENSSILISIPLKFVSMSQIDNKLALVQIMAWRQTGDKLLSEPMMA